MTEFRICTCIYESHSFSAMPSHTHLVQEHRFDVKAGRIEVAFDHHDECEGFEFGQDGFRVLFELDAELREAAKNVSIEAIYYTDGNHVPRAAHSGG